MGRYGTKTMSKDEQWIYSTTCAIRRGIPKHRWMDFVNRYMGAIGAIDQSELTV